MSHRLVTPPRLVATALCCAMAVSAVEGAAAVEQKRSYNLPSGDAATTLNQFAGASGQQIVFMMEKVKGERTNAIAGNYAAHDALDRMLAGTSLSATRDPATGAFVVSRKRTAEAAPRTGEVGPVSDPQPRPPTKTMKSPRTLFAALSGWLALGTAHSQVTRPIPVADETVNLSPFEVTASNRGYYGSNTMSGTRLNSRVEDLASSVTVVTKEQMADFAMLDLNDIFSHEASTEGTGNYTDLTFNAAGDPTDNVQLNPNTANRIRGIAPANLSFGNFATSGRVPIDRINIDGVEISRGPNSTIFGLGNASGTVNSVPASANLGRNRSQVEFRADSYDGYRSSIDLNRVLMKGTLAIRGSAVAQHEGFVRKPSGVDTTRFNGMVKYQPFKKTTVTAQFERYRLDGRRPNMTPPRDAITSWVEAGAPTWDPVTRTAFIDGKSIGVFSPSGGQVSPYFTNNLFVSNGGGSSIVAVNPDGTVGLWTPARPSSNNTPLSMNDESKFYVTTNPPNYRVTQPLFLSALAVTNKAIYDWSSINLAAMNNQIEATTTSMAQVEQFIVDTPRHLLAAQAGWYQEDSSSYRRLIYGTAGSTSTSGSRANSNYLFVDPNIRLLDGTPNPYFLRPYVGETSPATTLQPLKTETYRAQLAYRLDLTREKGRSKWLGMHQASAYGEYRHSILRRFSFRDALLSNHAWLAAGVPRASQGNAQAPQNAKPYNQVSPSVTRGYFEYFLGDNKGYNVDYAPGAVKYGTYPFSWGRNSAGAYVQEPAVLGEAADVSGTAAGNNNNTILKTKGVVLQSHLLNGRIITTFGVRNDSNYSKSAVPVSLLPDGLSHDYTNDNQWAGDWLARAGKTKTAGVVVKPLNWLFFHLNKSDSFKPANPAQNIHLQMLPNPGGKGEDYGFTLSVLRDTLNVRVNHYTTLQINSRNGTSGGFAGQALKMDIWDNSPSRLFGLSARAADWLTNAANAKGVTLTPDQLASQVADVLKLPVSTVAAMTNLAVPITATDDIKASGTEIELNYNPTNYWTIKFNATDQKTIQSAIAPDLLKWIEERMPVWKSVIDQDTGKPWISTPYGGVVAETYYNNNVTVPLGLQRVTVGKSMPQIRRYRFNLSSRYQLAGLSENKWLKNTSVGGSLRWEDKGAIGYYGVQKLPDIITDLDANRPIYDKANLYADVFASYRTKLFRDKVGATFQLNVRNIQENGHLQPISAFPDGTPIAYRIIDKRQFILTATFDL